MINKLIKWILSKFKKKEKYQSIPYYTPTHINCRCIATPIEKMEYRKKILEKSRKLDEKIKQQIKDFPGTDRRRK